jgi:hypothetical protein
MPRRGGLREILLAVRESALELMKRSTRATVRVAFGSIRDVTEIVSRSPVERQRLPTGSRARVALVHARTHARTSSPVFLCSVRACRVGAPVRLACVRLLARARCIQRTRALRNDTFALTLTFIITRACVVLPVCAPRVSAVIIVSMLFLSHRYFSASSDVVVVRGVVLLGIYECRADAAAPLRT